MAEEPKRTEPLIERGFRRLMLTAGCFMMIAPAAEFAVQISNKERPQVLLLGAFFLVGVLAVARALSPRASRAPRPRPVKPPPRYRSSEPLWLADPGEEPAPPDLDGPKRPE